MRLFSLFWDRISSNKWIRNAVRGYKIEFKRDPVQYKLPKKMPFSRDEKECISVEVEKLLGKGAIRRASFDPNQFLSNLFRIPKKGGELRLVITLKPLNHFEEYHHFKMEGLSSLLDLIRPNDYMITMDASQSGWGVTFENQSTNGEWSMEEKKQHINWLELQTVLLGLQSFLYSSCGGNVIKVFCDNSTAVAYVNNMGGKIVSLNCIAYSIWELCL